MNVTGITDRRFWTALAAVSGGMAVAAGAFAAHGLKSHSAEAAGLFETAAHYQMVHALAMIGVLALFRGATVAARAALAGFLLGTLLFSGSLYAFALSGWRPLLWLTPVGGAGFFLGWAALAIAARHNIE